MGGLTFYCFDFSVFFFFFFFFHFTTGQNFGISRFLLIIRNLFYQKGGMIGDVKITFSVHINYPQISLHECIMPCFEWIIGKFSFFPSLASLLSWMHFGEILFWRFSFHVYFYLFLCLLYLLFSTFFFLTFFFFFFLHIPLSLQNICIFIEFDCSLLPCPMLASCWYLFWRVLVIWGNGREGGGHWSTDGMGTWVCWDIKKGILGISFNVGI